MRGARRGEAPPPDYVDSPDGVEYARLVERMRNELGRRWRELDRHDSGDRGSGPSPEQIQRIAALEQALRRVGVGRFGVCDRCEGLISPSRLMAAPDTVFCLSCEPLEPTPQT